MSERKKAHFLPEDFRGSKAEPSVHEQAAYLGRYEWPNGEKGVAWFSGDGCMIQKVLADDLPHSTEEAEVALKSIDLNNGEVFYPAADWNRLEE